MRGIGRNRRVRAALAVAGLAAAGLAAAPAAATASTALPEGHGHAAFTLPEGTPKPTEPARVQSVYQVKTGTQTYTCTDAGAWSTTSTPEAQLVQYRGWGRIHHYAGPRWTARDGSTVVGKVNTPVPQTGTIPWLLLDVTAHENSKPGKELDAVKWISRVNTTGGVAPTGACTAGETRAVPYGADYVFWVPKKR